MTEPQPLRKPHTFELTIGLTDEAVPIFMKAMGNFLDIISIKERPAKESSDKVEELWEFCKLNGVVVRDDLVGFPGDGGFLLLKILKKIAELRTKEREQ